MPQFQFEDFAPQLVWLAITFISFYLFLARVVLPRIGAILEERKDRIARDLDEAAKLKAETEEAIASYEQALADAKANAQKIAQETRDKLTSEVDAERADVESKIAAEAAEAERRITETKAAALSHVKEAASETAEAIVTKLIGAQVGQADVSQAVDETMAK